MDSLEKPTLEILQPNWKGKAPANVEALMTLRKGGVSAGPFGDDEGVGGLNVGKYTGDFAYCVRTNRQLAAQLAPEDPVWLRQVHGTTVADAESAKDEDEADAIVSMTPGKVCLVQTADCLPILIAESSGRLVAAVHASWKCLALGILEASFRHINSRLGKGRHRFVAWIGPHIDAKSFEVGGDVIDFYADHGIDTAPYRTEAGQGKYFLDLGAVARAKLEALGVASDGIFASSKSTYTDPHSFYSFRRDGRTGRHATMIWIKNE